MKNVQNCLGFLLNVSNSEIETALLFDKLKSRRKICKQAKSKLQHKAKQN